MTLMDSLWENEFEHGMYLKQLKPKIKSITDSIKTKHENELYKIELPCVSEISLNRCLTPFSSEVLQIASNQPSG